MTLVPTDESKYISKRNEELRTKFRDLIRPITNDFDDYNKKYVKIKFNSDDNILLKKTLELHKMVIILRSVFHEDSKYYPQVFLVECFHKS